MDIIGALREEESKLQQRLTAVRGAITALHGTTKAAVGPGQTSSPKTAGKRTMSAAVRAKIARAAKARWAKIRAEKATKGK